MKLFATLLVAIVFVLLGWLITRPAVSKSYAESYQTAMRTLPGSTVAIDQGLERFRATFADLSSPTTRANVVALYAETIYFHDTLHRFDRNENLAAYMASMAQSIESSSVHIDQVVRDEADVFVRWTMHFVIRARGRELDSESIGMTHLRFNDRGEIILHQDFWDPASSLYRHIPVLGWLMDQVDRRIGGD